MVHTKDEEVWIDIPGYPNYKISSFGRVLNSKGKYLKVFSYSNGYCGIFLCNNGKIAQFRFHRLMLLCFEGPSELEVRHLDGDKKNNRLSNLKYGTHSENEEDKVKHGKVYKGESVGNSILTEDQVRWVRDFHRTHVLARKACGLKKAKNGLLRKLAKELNVDKHCLANVLANSYWQWVKP